MMRNLQSLMLLAKAQALEKIGILIRLNWAVMIPDEYSMLQDAKSRLSLLQLEASSLIVDVLHCFNMFLNNYITMDRGKEYDPALIYILLT